MEKQYKSMSSWEEVSPPDEFLRTCGKLHRDARNGTLTEEDINHAVNTWDHYGYEAYNWIIDACLGDKWPCDLISTMDNICHSMRPKTLPDSEIPSVDMPLFLIMDEDPISILLQKLFRRSCYLAATTPLPPPMGTVVYAGYEGYTAYLIVKRYERSDWYLYEYHDTFDRRHHRNDIKGFDNWLGRFATLAEALDNCGQTDELPCRDLQISLCEYVESKYHVRPDNVPNMLDWDRAKYLVLLSSLPDDHYAAISYIITRTSINYKFRKLPVPIEIYEVKSLSQALENWVASTMDAIGIDCICSSTFPRTPPGFHSERQGRNLIIKSHERAARILQRLWRRHSGEVV